MQTNTAMYAKDPTAPVVAPLFVSTSTVQFIPGHRVGGQLGHYVCLSTTCSMPPASGGRSNDIWHWVPNS